MQNLTQYQKARRGLEAVRLARLASVATAVYFASQGDFFGVCLMLLIAYCLGWLAPVTD